MPPPKVNHHAEKPLVNASCAVPMVDAPPTRVPMSAPMTIPELAFLPPSEKSFADFTCLPENIPTRTMRMRTRSAPI